MKLLNEKLVSSCIDHIYIRSSNILAKSAVIFQKMADHYFITCHLSSICSSDENRDSRKPAQIVGSRRFHNLILAYGWVAFLDTVDYSNGYSKFVEVVSVLRNRSRVLTVRQRRSDCVSLNPLIRAAKIFRDVLRKCFKHLPKKSPEVPICVGTKSG